MRLLACCVLLWTGVAWAAPSKQATHTKPAPTGRELYDRGTAAFALHKYADAADLYEQAFALTPIPAILYNAAQAQRLAGHTQRALTLYESCQKLYAEPLKQYAADIRLHIDELHAALAPPPPAPPPVVVTPLPVVVVSEPPPPPKPVYKRGWFWGAVTAGVVVVGGAIAVGVVFGTRTRPAPAVTFGSVAGN